MLKGNSKYTGTESSRRDPNFGDIGLLYVSNILPANSNPLGYRQWGILTPSGAAPWTCALPISYPHKNFSNVLTRASGGYCFSVIATKVTANSITWIDYDAGGNSGSGDSQFMISIGY